MATVRKGRTPNWMKMDKRLKSTKEAKARSEREHKRYLKRKRAA